MKNKDEVTITLKGIKPTPLNRMYTPVVKNHKPSIILSKEARETKKLIQMEVLRQKQNKMLEGKLHLRIDFCIKRGSRDNDIDNSLKLLMDSLEGLCYKNDSQICRIEIRKHLEQEENEYNFSIKKIDSSS